jgi:Protein of unknown function (DUF2281)
MHFHPRKNAIGRYTRQKAARSPILGEHEWKWVKLKGVSIGSRLIMGAAILEQLQNLPEPLQQKALQYIESLLAEYEQEYDQAEEEAIVVNRQNVFGIWKGQVHMSDDFDVPLEDLKEYM